MSEKRNWKSFALELLLIVVGINLGLFVNNLNEQRKETKLERQLLSELKTCLEGDLEDVNINIKIHSDCANYTSKLLAYIQTKEPIDSLAHHFNYTNGWSFFINNTSTYESLKSIGFGIIKNDELRQRITELYNVYYRANDEFENRFHDLNSKWTDVLIANTKGEWWNYDDKTIETKMAKIDNLEYYVSAISSAHDGANQYYSKRLKPKILELIALIDKELGE